MASRPRRDCPCSLAAAPSCRRRAGRAAVTAEPAAREPAAPPPAPEPARRRGSPGSRRDRRRPRQTGQPVYHTSAVYGGKPEPKPVKRRTIAVTVTAGVLAVLLVALVLVLTVFKPGNPPPAHGIIPTGTSPQQDGQQVASAFLTAWQAGDLAKAANYTDQPAAASAALAAYAKDLNLEEVRRLARRCHRRDRVNGREAEGERHVRGQRLGRGGQRLRRRCAARGRTTPRSWPTSSRTRPSGSSPGSPTWSRPT